MMHRMRAETRGRTASGSSAARLRSMAVESAELTGLVESAELNALSRFAGTETDVRCDCWGAVGWTIDGVRDVCDTDCGGASNGVNSGARAGVDGDEG